MGNKIPGQHQQIWSKGLGQLYRPLQGLCSQIWPKMHVTDLRNSKAVELFRQSVEPYVDALGHQIFRFQEKGVGGSERCHRGSSNQESIEESPACQQLLLHIRSLASPLRLQSDWDARLAC